MGRYTDDLYASETISRLGLGIQVKNNAIVLVLCATMAENPSFLLRDRKLLYYLVMCLMVRNATTYAAQACVLGGGGLVGPCKRPLLCVSSS